MIPVEQAKQIIRSVSVPGRIETVPLANALGLTVAQDIVATSDIPAFAQTSMDGYAIRFAEHKDVLRITGKMQAGSTKPQQLEPGEAMRIFTGAPLPEGADTIVMQEKAEVQDGCLIIKDEQPALGQHVRPKGAEVRKTETAMVAGTHVSPAALGFLAGIGCNELAVYAPPSVTILLTGDELQQPGRPLSFGQVYDANSFQLTAALQKTGVRNIRVRYTTDTAENVRAAIEDALAESDLLLITGGVSVGDYDLVVPAANACGVETLFHKIRQKPGKPLFFGKKNERIVFGLPGNPSSALTCFYEYVLPLIESGMHLAPAVKLIKARTEQAYKKSAGLTHFIKSVYCDGKVTALHAQESFRLHSFAQSNCLMVLPEETEGCETGDIVEIHLLPV